MEEGWPPDFLQASMRNLFPSSFVVRYRRTLLLIDRLIYFLFFSFKSLVHSRRISFLLPPFNIFLSVLGFLDGVTGVPDCVYHLGTLCYVFQCLI